jgi:hypothetical protein
LVITYRELRKLELEVLKKLHKNDQQILDISAIIRIDVNQFYGIEIEEFPAQIAQVALWLTDHQMNQQISEHFGAYFARIPLKKSANIVNANALQTDWHSVCPNASFIVGNPPFIGKNYRNEQQDADMARVFTGMFNAPMIESTPQGSNPDVNHHSFRPVSTDRQTQSSGDFGRAVGSDCAQHSDSTGWIGNENASRSEFGLLREKDGCSLRADRRQIQSNVLDDFSQHSHVDVNYRKNVFHALVQTLSPIRLYKSLDFVSAWHYTATAYLKNHSQTKVAFVSTNSITQGEQVAILWQPLLDAGVSIHFAHRTFSWTNEAKGKAAVHCVIIGFALHDTPNKTLFVYDDIKGEPHAVAAKNINPYLLDAPNLVVTARSAPICNVPEIVYGSKPTDGGYLFLTEDEKNILVQQEPQAEKWIKPFLGADEFLNNTKRYCLWLVDCSPNELRAMPLVLKRVEAVKAMRLASTKEATRNDASKPALFAEVRQPKQGHYLLVPLHTSENRNYVPLGYFTAETICGNANSMIPNATLYHFGILTSTMHNAWMRTTSGRLESRYRYSANLVYNNFPWPEIPSPQPSPRGRGGDVMSANEVDSLSLGERARVREITAIETAAQAVLDARAQFPDASLADLYDPRTMPPDLAKAHTKLDKTVDAAYGYKGANNDGERVAFLFDLYQQMTSLLVVEKGKRSRKTP